MFFVAVAEQELIWANGEENPNLFTLFRKFAELHWMYNDAANSMANKVSKVTCVSRDNHVTPFILCIQQSGVRKTFKNIFQEEKVLEESKKELQNCTSKLTKLQKQVSY